MAEGWRILTHGGAGSDPQLTDLTDQAAEVAREALAEGAEPIDAACRAVAFLESDGRFNAGPGSYRRADGSSLQMDAACADAEGRFGAVACIEQVAHPIEAARRVTETDHLVLAGRGALAFAREHGLEPMQPERASDRSPSSGSDTVGCVLGDGEAFAAALSSGGTREAMVGRVGDVPLPGCGLRAGPAGAVAATGHGESIARPRLADQAYERLLEGCSPARVVEQTLAAFGERFPEASLGLIVVGEAQGAGGSNRSMAFTSLDP